MNTGRKIFFFILLLISSPIFGQGKWVQYITTVNGGIPTAAAFLNEQYGFVETNTGWYRTTDGGKNWISILGLPRYTASHLNFYYYTPDTIFVNGKFESDDSGFTWKGLPQPTISNSLYYNAGIFYD